MTCRILVVGAGITGAITGWLLRNLYKENLYLVIWDKAKERGGRMNTSHNPFSSSCFVDLGAQYITLSQDNLIKHSDIYEALISNKLLEPLHRNIEGIKQHSESTKHFTAVNGMSSLVNHFLDGAASEIHLQRCVTKIFTHGKLWKVQTKCGVEDIFNIVILTIPAPQIIELEGSIQEIICRDSGMQQNLQSVKFSSRYAIGLFFKAPCRFYTGWDSKYVYDDPIFRYISVVEQQQKTMDELGAVMFHTSVQYGESNIQRDLDDVRNELMNHIKKLFPKWPEPDHIECCKWLYSQVVTPYPGKPGCVTISNNPKLVVGGDSFTSSHIDDCISSAINLVNSVNKDIKESL